MEILEEEDRVRKREEDTAWRVPHVKIVGLIIFVGLLPNGKQ